jgi:hypothetical protein
MTPIMITLYMKKEAKLASFFFISLVVICTRDRSNFGFLIRINYKLIVSPIAGNNKVLFSRLNLSNAAWISISITGNVL